MSVPKDWRDEEGMVDWSRGYTGRAVGHPPPEDVSDADWLAMCQRAHHAEARVVALTVRAQNAEEEVQKLRVSVAKLRDQLAQKANPGDLGKSA